MNRQDEIAAGLARVRERIDSACAAVGRTDHVELVVVTKTFPASDVAILADLGVRHVAENRDQEARAKREELGEDGLVWHMIGQLQRNKAASVARWADVVESVDRPELVAALSKAAAGRELRVLIQVDLDPDPRPDRGGAAPDEVLDLAGLIDADPSLSLAGLMAVAPHPGDPDEAFARLAVVSSRLRSRFPQATVLSAGMSDDLEQAIAHGATQVRVGGAVLGHRAYVQ